MSEKTASLPPGPPMTDTKQLETALDAVVDYVTERFDWDIAPGNSFFTVILAAQAYVALMKAVEGREEDNQRALAALTAMKRAHDHARRIERLAGR